VLIEPGAPGFAMGFVRFFVDCEVGQSGRLFDAVEFAQAVNFGARDFGDLRFVGVEGGDSFGYRTVAANFAESGDYGFACRAALGSR